jgi:dissimilatory sulfite reductase (desulfoviridin) alpha/beta subunit
VSKKKKAHQFTGCDGLISCPRSVIDCVKIKKKTEKAAKAQQMSVEP